MCVASSTNGKSASAACGSGTRIDGFEGPVLARSGAPDQGRQDSLGSGLCIWTWRRLGEGFSVWTCACVQLGFGNTGTRGEARSTKAESHLDGVNYAGGGCEVGTYVLPEVGTYVLPEDNTFRRRSRRSCITAITATSWLDQDVLAANAVRAILSALWYVRDVWLRRWQVSLEEDMGGGTCRCE